MRRNRAIRNQIEAATSVDTVDELERWNDGAVDSLSDVGLELSAEEEAAQDRAFQKLAQVEGV